MVDLGIHRLTRTRIGRAVYETLGTLGLTGTAMHVYGVALDEAAVDRSPPTGIGLDVVRAGALSVRPDEDFDELESDDIVALARDADAASAVEMRPADVDAVRGWVFVSVDRPVAVTELATTVRFGGAYVWHLFVEPECRGRGVASALLARALTSASDAGADAAFALVATDNAPSKRAFEGRGFEVLDAVAYYRAFEWERRRGPLHGEEEYRL